MIYLDNAATSYPKPVSVLRETLNTLTAPLGNPGRSGHSASLFSGNVVFRARESLAQLIGLNRCERIVFTSGATAALNLAITGTCLALCEKGHTPFVVTSVFEHNSVLRPLFSLEKKGLIQLSVLSPEKDGNLSAEYLERTRPDVVAVTCKSNTTGHLFPLRPVFDRLRRKGCIVILDAAQAMGSQICTFADTGASILCAAGHKGLFGMMGGGFLALREDLPLLPEPILLGGSGSETFNPSMPSVLPDLLEAGTLPVPAIASMDAGARFLLREGVQGIWEKEKEDKRILTEGILNLPGFLLYEPEYKSGPVLFNRIGVKAEELAALLAEKGIMARAGFHCAPLAHRYLGSETSGAVRLSPGLFTEKKDLYRTLFVLSKL